MVGSRVSMALAGLAATLAVSTGAFAQNYPSKAVRIVTTAAGGSNDVIARMLGGAINGPLGQPVIVDNRPAGVIPNETVAKAPADGHTMLLAGSGMWIGTLFEKMSYEPLRDFTPIILISEEPNMLVVPASLPVKSVEELIALARSRPGSLNYVATSIGGSLHLAGELLKSMGGINIVRVSYKGSAAAMPDLMSGTVHLAIMGVGGAVPLVASGKLKGLAVSGLKPSQLAPGLPTIAATLPGYEAVGLTAILGPAKLPPAIVDRLNQEFGRALTQPDLVKKLTDFSQEMVGGPPERLASAMRSDMAKWGKLIKEAGLQAQ